MSLLEVLSKIDYRFSRNAFSRPQYQVLLLVNKINSITKRKFNILLDVGGGFTGVYKSLLSPLTNKYINLEIKRGSGVDIVGSVYKIPLKNNSVDAETLFMVLEHLNEPKRALIECNRVLKKGGYLILTTVQYWHTHSYPSDYYRYTKYGLEYIFEESGFNVVNIWSMGGPFLVIFHAIELNIPNSMRTIYSIGFYRLMDWLDWIFFKHEDKRRPNNDSVGWSVIAQKI